MRQAAGELAHRLHLLRLAQHLFHPLALDARGLQPCVGVGELPHVQLLLGKVGEDAAEQRRRLLAPQHAERKVDGKVGTPVAAKRQLASGRRGACALEQRGQSRRVVGQDEVAEWLTDEPLLRHVQHRREALVAVENLALDRESQRAFLDLLDQHAVGPVGALQRVDLPRTARHLHDHGVEVAALDRLQRLLAFLEPGLEIADTGLERNERRRV